MKGLGESARRRLVDSLKRLTAVGMVEPRKIEPDRDRWKGWNLLSDDGSGKIYRRPKTGIEVPAPFFLNGWHLVLTASELACYLMLLHASTRSGAMRNGDPVGVPRETRVLQYGLSDAVYSTHNELTD